MVPVITLSKVDQIMSIDSIRAIEWSGIVIIPQIHWIHKLIVVRRSRREVLREGVVYAVLYPARGLVPGDLQTVVIGVEVVLQGINVLIKGEWTNGIILLGIEGGNTIGIGRYVTGTEVRQGLEHKNRW